jgi:hypothetical protein
VGDGLTGAERSSKRARPTGTGVLRHPEGQRCRRGLRGDGWWWCMVLDGSL